MLESPRFLNQLTQAVLQMDQLFATLDPLTRLVPEFRSDFAEYCWIYPELHQLCWFMRLRSALTKVPMSIYWFMWWMHQTHSSPTWKDDLPDLVNDLIKNSDVDSLIGRLIEGEFSQIFIIDSNFCSKWSRCGTSSFLERTSKSSPNWLTMKSGWSVTAERAKSAASVLWSSH